MANKQSMQILTMWGFNDIGVIPNNQIAEMLSEYEKINFGYRALKAKVEWLKLREKINIPDIAMAFCADMAEGNPAFSQIYLAELISHRVGDAAILPADVSEVWPLKLPTNEDHTDTEYDKTFKRYDSEGHSYNLFDTRQWWDDRVAKKHIEWVLE